MRDYHECMDVADDFEEGPNHWPIVLGIVIVVGLIILVL